MKKNFHHFLMLMALLPSFAMGQSQNLKRENPRGVYKLMTIIAYEVEQYAPYEQYKICTDSVSLTMSVNNQGLFNIQDNDKLVLNYTGKEVKGDNDTQTKIFDSDKDGFSLMWWSTVKNNLYFPYNDWCIEKYKAGEYSPEGRKIFDMLTQKTISDESNALIGTWRILGIMDELHKVKAQLQDMREKNPTINAQSNLLVFTADRLWLASVTGVGVPIDIKYESKSSINYAGKSHKIKWHDKNTVIVEYQTEFATNYEVYERITDNLSMLERMAGWIMNTTGNK